MVGRERERMVPTPCSEGLNPHVGRNYSEIYRAYSIIIIVPWRPQAPPIRGRPSLRGYSHSWEQGDVKYLLLDDMLILFWLGSLNITPQKSTNLNGEHAKLGWVKIKGQQDWMSKHLNKGYSAHLGESSKHVNYTQLCCFSMLLLLLVLLW